ncbi:hypothetical protein [Clostridium sp. JS66]|uniref:hypothetical protein n=1 Tax=Clostridium sp. JS66 TaxID=3064705 RepID=UPI00298EB07C|nr:hypothetical protein [Clostridium sp. JS66]WPC44368.1 hypothetical protein Q6H37_13085 [Clostridium sp. JS66]
MWFIEFLQKSLEGRGFYPYALAIFAWTYTFVLLVVAIYQFFLYVFRIKYNNPEFNNFLNKNTDKKEQENE